MNNLNDLKKKKGKYLKIMPKNGNHSHAWHGTWDRPMKMDETKMHPFTVARMTDHNVKGDDEPATPAEPTGRGRASDSKTKGGSRIEGGKPSV